MKALNKLNEKQLLKMATEKVWKEFKDKVESGNRLKELLKCVLNKEREFFTYTWRINDVMEYGTMYGDNYEVYSDILKILNYTQNYENYDSQFTREVDAGFIWNEDYYGSNLVIFNYIFNTSFEREFYTDNLIYRQDIRAREKGVSFILSEKARNFLKNAGYSIYKSWFNCGNGFRLPKFIVF